MSKTPHARPPQKMARNALDEVEEAADAAEAGDIGGSFSMIKPANGWKLLIK
jgi:hypothetical protein